MTPVLANEHELYFERGGPSYRLLQRIGLIRGEDPSIRRRVLAFLAVTWVPLLILSALEGRALGPTPRESFPLDFAAYGQDPGHHRRGGLLGQVWQPVETC